MSELKDGGLEIEFGFDDDFVAYYEDRFKKKLTRENFQKTMLEAMHNSLEKEDKTIVEEKIVDSFASDFMSFPPPNFFNEWFRYKPSHLWNSIREKIKRARQKLTTGFPHHEAYGFTDWFAQAALPRLKFLRDTTHSFPDLTDETKRYGETDASDEGLVKWKAEIDKIIWSLEHYDDDIQPIPPENYNPQSHKTTFSDGSVQYAPIDERPHDFAPCKDHKKRVQDGLDLFAKHFYDLWS